MLASSGVRVLVSTAAVGSGLAGFQVAGRPAGIRGKADRDAFCGRQACKFIQALEGEFPLGQGLGVKPLSVTGDEAVIPVFDANPATRVLNIRARLGHLTGDAFHRPGTQWDPELQATSRRLQRALQDAMGYMFDKAPLERGWNEMQALAWSTVCIYSLPFTNPSLVVRPSVAMPIYFLARRKAPQQWAIDEYQLAAVISLWRSSITRLAIRQHPRRKIMQGVGDGRPTAAAIRLWVAGEGALQQKWARLDKDEMDGLVPFRLSAGFILDDSDEWFPYVDGAPSANFPQSDLEKLPLLALETSGTLLEMIAQDIFSTFMFEATSVMHKLSEVAVRQPPGASGHPTILRSGNTMSSTLSNPHVDALARILCGSGLATEEAALMCIIPALFHHSKLPSLDDSVELLLSDVEMLRNNRQCERGEAQLKALFKICSSGHQERVVRILGEMYREACRSPSETQYDFGLRGMASLRRNLVNAGAAARQTLSQSAMTAFADYEKLYGFLKDRPSWRRDPRKPQNREQLPMLAVLELHKGLAQPREGHGRCRFETMLVLEKYDMTGRGEAPIHELLFTAIALGHVEVLEDLKVLNPYVLVEQPVIYAAALPDGAEPLTRHITSRFNSEALDNQGGVLPTGCGAVGFLAVAWAAAQLEREARVPGEAEGVLRTMLDWALRAKTPFVDADNNTALMYAVGSGNAAAVDILLECGADFQVANASGETALSRAVTAG